MGLVVGQKTLLGEEVGEGKSIHTICNCHYWDIDLSLQRRCFHDYPLKGPHHNAVSMTTEFKHGGDHITPGRKCCREFIVVWVLNGGVDMTSWKLLEVKYGNFRLQEAGVRDRGGLGVVDGNIGTWNLTHGGNSQGWVGTEGRRGQSAVLQGPVSSWGLPEEGEKKQELLKVEQDGSMPRHQIEIFPERRYDQTWRDTERTLAWSGTDCR